MPPKRSRPKFSPKLAEPATANSQSGPLDEQTSRTFEGPFWDIPLDSNGKLISFCVDNIIPAHIIRDHSYFETYVPGRKEVKGVHGSRFNIEGTGTVRISLSIKGFPFQFLLYDCWHVPTSIGHFFSVSRFVATGAQVMLASRSPRIIFSEKQRRANPSLPKYLPLRQLTAAKATSPLRNCFVFFFRPILPASAATKSSMSIQSNPSTKPLPVIAFSAPTIHPFAGFSVASGLERPATLDVLPLPSISLSPHISVPCHNGTSTFQNSSLYGNNGCASDLPLIPGNGGVSSLQIIPENGGATMDIFDFPTKGSCDNPLSNSFFHSFLSFSHQEPSVPLALPHSFSVIMDYFYSSNYHHPFYNPWIT